jgi:multidrug resistance efflux pump
MNTRQAMSQLKAAEAALAIAEAQHKQAEDLEEQHDDLIAQQTAAVAAKRAELERVQAIHDKVKNQLDLKGSKEDVTAAGAAVKEVTQAIIAEEAKLRALQKRNIKLDIDRAAGDVQAKRELVEQARIALDECFVVAPGNGTILRLMVNKGDVLGPTARQPAILFCPSGKRIIRAEVEQEWAGRVQMGQRVIVEDDSRSAGEWRGTVRNISEWYAHKRSILLEPRQFNDVRTLEVIVDLDDDQGLRIGQRVRVIFGK